jgi:hypothetical protein
MPIQHVPNEGQNYEFPFAFLPSKDIETNGEYVIGKGWESIVKQLGPDWVIKEANPFNLQGKERSQEMLDFLREPERVKEMTETQVKLEEIFGKEHFARSFFVYGRDQNGKEGYMLVQRLIQGRTLADLIGTEYTDTQDMISKNREQFMDIVWGLKKSFIEFGVPLDFHPGNLMRDEKSGNIVITDTGIPIEEYRILTDVEITKRTANILENAYGRMEKISWYEELLQLTDEEKKSLNEKYSITDELLEQKVRNIDGIRTEKGIDISNGETPADKLLDSIFGSRKEVTGREIYDYAIQVLGSNQPTESQKAVLDELDKQGNIQGDRDHWRRIIDL